jgi:hypothetical protein
MFSCCCKNSVKVTSLNNFIPVIKVIPYNHNNNLLYTTIPYNKQVDNVLKDFGLQSILDNDTVEIIKVENNIIVKIYYVKKDVSQKTNYIYNSTISEILIQIDYSKIYSYI